ncbi:MAG: (d)CMP kinase [Chitinophagales bacterium]
MRSIVIAIDGYSGCGKSTLAKQLAEKLNYIFLDTGAMYRAVTLYLMDHGIDWNDPLALQDALAHIHISCETEKGGRSQVLLNGMHVEDRIRTMEVAGKVSEVAAVSAVRRFLVKQQQQIGEQGGIVMDGRDIGTVVFPDAALKIFVTARMEVRVHRRLKDLHAKGIAADAEDVEANLRKRDLEETSRKDSPLLRADDAILLDNSDLTPEAQLQWAFDLAAGRISA